MARLNPRFRTENPVLNTMRLLEAGARPMAHQGRVVCLIVPEKLYDYSPPRDKDIAGYMGDAEMLCDDCVRTMFAQGQESAEQALDRAAREQGIRRSDERNYDSSTLPKPIALDEFEHPECCGRCLKYFGLDPADFRRCPDPNCGSFVSGTEGYGTCVNCGHEYSDADLKTSPED